MWRVPLTVPLSVGLYDTFTEVWPPLAASIVPGGGELTIEKPVRVTAWMLVAAAPMFVTVIVWDSVSPARIVGRTAGLGEIASALSMPLHASGMPIDGFEPSLLEIVRVPLRPPVAVGLQVTVTPSLAPAPSPCEPVLPLTAKPPVAVTELIVAVEPPEFVIVTPTPVDAVFTRTPPKLMLPGDALTWIGGGVPVPYSVRGGAPALVFTVTTHEVGAATDGWNTAVK